MYSNREDGRQFLKFLAFWRIQRRCPSYRELFNRGRNNTRNLKGYWSMCVEKNEEN
jgi:hypothetical protein